MDKWRWVAHGFGLNLVYVCVLEGMWSVEGCVGVGLYVECAAGRVGVGLYVECVERRVGVGKNVECVAILFECWRVNGVYGMMCGCSLSISHLFYLPFEPVCLFFYPFMYV